MKKYMKYFAKPMSTNSGRGLFPTVFVDLSTKRCGPRMHKSLMVPMEYPTQESSMVRVKDPFVFEPDQAALAASQWGSCGDQPDNKPWLKSWYFPTDAFDPWPQKQLPGVICWHCCYEFDWAPFPLPRSRESHSGRWRVLAGGFCGPSCAKAYAQHSLGLVNLGNVFAWIDEIAANYYNYRTAKGHYVNIPVAPKKELLQKFCGPKGLTIEQYRTLCACGRKLTLLDPGFITLKQVIEAEDEFASRKLVNGTNRVCHREDPDNIKSIEDMVKVRRSVYGGRGARPMSSFFQNKAKKD